MNQEVLVKDMVRTMTLPKVTHPHPIAIIFVGPPASGKTTFAKKIVSQLPIAYFSNEQIENYLMPHVDFFDNNAITMNFSFEVIKELIRQKISVVFDYSVDNIADRQRIRKEVEGTGGKLMIVYFETDDAEIFRRIQNSNIRIVEGAKKGFILDQDYYFFKKSKIQSPLSEDAFVVNNNDKLADEKFTTLLQAKLTSDITDQ